ncbi:protein DETOXIFICATION 15-like, partial [Dendrobium catenatum]|uniref:protein DETOXIFICATION 15-like n=1 Tax=Dendrobium catenatum TaxID=906689 RepID=UPI00109F4991
MRSKREEEDEGKRLMMMRNEETIGRDSQEKIFIVAAGIRPDHISVERMKRGIRASGILKYLMGFANDFNRQNISSLVYAIPLGLSGAISTRISNELGAQNPGAAVLAILTAAVAIIIEGLIVGFGMIGGRNLWGHLYTKEREVVNAVAVMIPWIALSHFIDGFQCVLLGTIRGSGRQKMGVFVCLGSYYLVGIPASILLGFVFHMDVKGLWIGNICAIFVQDAVLLIMTMFTNWEKQ